jgi:hypothetical protein
MRILTEQWNSSNFRDERRQRLYLKDIDCPPEWHEHLRKVIPPNLFYLNDDIARNQDSNNRHSRNNVPAQAGDLMSSLPPHMRAQNLMCYVGHEGTYTPAHREMCASLGQNIMVDASGDGDGEKPGSSVWFMTETKDREVVREYFLSMLGHDIEVEKHFAQINAWKKATFPVYIVEQRAGDFILVPPLAPHQVWNRGTRTIKVAWNRTTVETLEMALNEALPRSRLVCRDEQYKNKAIVYFTLQKYCQQMLDLQARAELDLQVLGQGMLKNSARLQQMTRDIKKLLALFTEILVDEMFASEEADVEYIKFDSNVTCSYCRANIFNRFLTCKHCVRELDDGEEDTYDVCMDCYAMGRSCLCISRLHWCEQWKWSELVGKHEAWRMQVIRNDEFVDLDLSPMPLEVARKKRGTRTIAEVCQEQLRKRPWKDITKPDEPHESESSEREVDATSPTRKRKTKQKKGNVFRCHICRGKDYTYKLAFCSTPRCNEAYCYGVLYRAFDLMPQSVMQNERWKCPKCLKICSCSSCRRQKHGNPYLPRTTLLGHDTRHVADDRSTEALVDFRSNNLSWLKSAGDESRNVRSKRMKRLQQAADAEKAKDKELVTNIAHLPASDESFHRNLVITNGLVKQENILGDVAPALIGHDSHSARPQSNKIRSDAVGFTEHGSTPPNSSSYPDPSTLPELMVGMAYYDQDDSPDKILFDPYHTPRADAASMNDFEAAQQAATPWAEQHTSDDSDYAKTPTNRRKRAKLGNDSPYLGQHEALNNMDPALFSQGCNVNQVSPNQALPGLPELQGIRADNQENRALVRGDDGQELDNKSLPTRELQVLGIGKLPVRKSPKPTNTQLLSLKESTAVKGKNLWGRQRSGEQ